MSNTILSFTIGVWVTIMTGCNSFQSTTFTARGCCPTCETAILESININGVKKASWNQFDERLTVKFKHKEISVETLQISVVRAGYDTDLYMADDSTYLELPKCCQYRD